MKQKLVSLIAAGAIFSTAATTVQAEQVVVHKGDTLWGLSQEYGVSVESLKKWNNLSSDLIHPNDLLEVSPIKQVVVRKGDTLWDIAQVFEVSVEDLMKWNKLSSDLIHPGLKLTIYTNIKAEQTNSAPAPAAANEVQASAQKGQATAEDKPLATATTQSKTVDTVEAPKQEAQSTEAPAAETEKAVGPKQEVQASAQPAAEPEHEPAGKEITVEATAYTASCEGCSGITSTGVNLKANPDAKVISVDPSVIPLGSKVHVEGYGYATAADTGGAIKGNKIDVFVPNYDDAVAWGRKQVKVTIID